VAQTQGADISHEQEGLEAAIVLPLQASLAEADTGTTLLSNI
jgi:hypothetical protein